MFIILLWRLFVLAQGTIVQSKSRELRDALYVMIVLNVVRSIRSFLIFYFFFWRIDATNLINMVIVIEKEDRFRF